LGAKIRWTIQNHFILAGFSMISFLFQNTYQSIIFLCKPELQPYQRYDCWQTTQGYETFKEFIRMIRHDQGEKKGGTHMIRALDELKMEGRLEGRMEGRLEGRMEGELKSRIAIIENMRNNNYDWQSIYQVTGVDSARLEEMKEELVKIQTLSLVAAEEMNKSTYSQQHSQYYK